MNQTTRHSLTLFTLLSVPTFLGCGLSNQVNGQIDQLETQAETEAVMQMLGHTNLLVGGVMAQSSPVEPAAQCSPVPSSQCTVCYKVTPTEQAVDLSTPGCAINPPQQTQQYSLTLTLNDLSLAADRKTPTLVVLSGHGRLDVGAELPVFGAYHGVAQYQVQSDSSIDTQSGQFNLDLLLSYTNDDGSLLQFTIQGKGSRSGLTGSITGPKLKCSIGGTLSSPKISCQ